MTKNCTLCGAPTANEFICDHCEDAYGETSQIEKRPKGHVVDGGTWWRVNRSKTVKKGA